MQVLELLQQQEDRAAFLARYQELYPKNHGINDVEVLARVIRDLQDQDAVAPEVDIFVHNDEEAGGIIVSGKDRAGELYGIALMDWTEWKTAEVVVDEDLDLTELDTACYVLWELTFFGPPANQRKERARILGQGEYAMDEEDFVEIGPGIKASPQVLAMMEKSGELNEILKSLNFEEMKGAGKRLKG